VQVLNVNMSLDPVTGGGTAERTLQISRALAKAGHCCTILTTDFGLTETQADRVKGITIIGLRCINKRFYLPRFSYVRVSKIVSDADVIHIMGHWTFINALTYIIARRQKKPYVVCPAGALPLYGRSKFFKQIYNYIIGRNIICNANGHIAITSDEVRQFIPYGVVPSGITIISNGINADDFQDDRIHEFRDKHGLGQTPFVLFVGRLNQIKGPDLLLQAFCAIKAQMPKHHLVFIGPDGGMLSALKKMAEECKMAERVHFLGYLGGNNKSQAYHAADLLVIPSRQEAMSIVVLEAGAAGTPVLLTDQCGFNEVAHIRGGRVVPATVKGLQSGLIEMLASSDHLRTMGVNLKQYVREQLTWDVAVSKYISLYNDILFGKN
jgi:glycosyltransferase involved in cell wall biosynthesis